MTYFSIRTLCAREHEPWVRHVVAQVHVGPTAQNPASFLQRDIRFYGNGVGTNDGPAGTSLALDFPAFGVSGRARTDSPQGGKVWDQPLAMEDVQSDGVVRPRAPYLISHLAKELLKSLPQLP